MPQPALPYRLDLWTAPAPAGGVRAAFLVAEAGRVARAVRRTRALDAGQSELTFEIAGEFDRLDLLTPMQSIVRLTRFEATGPDAYVARVEEYRVQSRTRTVRGGVGPYQIRCTPLEDVLLDLDCYRTIGSGGLASWRYGAVDRTPEEILDDLVARASALGYGWFETGTVTPTTPDSIYVARPTFRTIVDALLAALAAKGVTVEFQLVLASDLSAYRFELVTAVAGSLAPLVARTDANVRALEFQEDALELATTVIPFGAEAIDLRDLQLRVSAVDGGTGWLDLEPLDGSDALLIALDDQFNGRRLFRELTGRSFAITDTQADPPRVRVATADLATGLAAGETVSFREADDESGTRRFGVDEHYPVEVVSTATSPNRIRTRRLLAVGGTNWLGVANQLRDWTAERSRFVFEWPAGTLDLQASTYTFPDPGALPPIFADDWFLFTETSPSVALVSTPLRVTNIALVGSDVVVTFAQRYPGTQTTLDGVITAVARHYRPVSTPMRILATAVTDNELTVDALTGAGLDPFVNTDVLELWQRCQGERLVELTDPGAAGRRVAFAEVPEAHGATNLLPNGDFSAWAGGSGDPPDGFSVVDVVGTVTRTRVTAPELTRFGGHSWRVAFAAGASAEILSPAVPINPVAGADQVAGAVALLFERFTGDQSLQVRLYRVGVDGGRQALGDPLTIYPPDTTLSVDASLKPGLQQWYDAAITNVSLLGVQADRIQVGVRRPAGGGNPACSVVLDAFLLLQRPGLPQAPEGGVAWFFGSDATRLLTAGNRALLTRRTAEVRLEARVLDVFRLSPTAYAPWALVVGRSVTLEVPALSLTRATRLVRLAEDLDDAGAAEVSLETRPPDVTRLLAAALAPTPAAPLITSTALVETTP